MEITTTFTEASLHEMNKAQRQWPYWPVQFVGHPRIFTLLAGFALFAIRGLYIGFTASPLDGDNLLTGFVLLALITIVIVVLIYRDRAGLRKKALSVPTIRLTFDDTGFSTKSTRYEWTQFSGFTAGTHIVFLIMKNSRKKRMTIPIDTLSPLETGQLRSILLSHLPEQ